MTCNCTDHIHSFLCYLRNMATDANESAKQYPDVKNAR